MHIIGDELTITGMQLAGFKNVRVASKENITSIVKEVAEKARITLVTQELAQHAKKEIEKLQKAGKMIVEIPDRTGGGEDFTNQLIKDVIGFNLKK